MNNMIQIATANNRKAKKWNNREVEWDWLVNKCMKTKRTPETLSQYMKMSKDEQSDVKDVGGFVGGVLREGKRRKGYVEGRSVITLDIDNGTPDTWDDFKMNFDCAAFIYTTHKHTPEKPRYRLVILLDRLVQPDEYEPIARRVAEKIGIESIDHTTHELPRLFFWPSTSKDATFFADKQPGAPLCADEILATYTDYHNAAEWPTSVNEKNSIKREIKKAENPTEKEGVIGAFCRTYTIEDAILTFLQDVYEPTADEHRFTYKAGTTSQGLVCYDNKFAYSHHESDPAGLQLCNAFDLVRLHLFGAKDEKSIAEGERRPSVKCMLDFARNDEATRRTIIEEREKSASEDFQDFDTEDDECDWKTKLIINKKGECEAKASNILLILNNDDKLKNRLQFNLFDQEIHIEEDLPWKHTGDGTWSDGDDKQFRIYLELKYSITKCPTLIKDCVYKVAAEHQVHPLRDYLTGLKWDGVERLDTLFIDRLGAEDTPINRAFTRKFFTAAVARVIEPGTPFDFCPILCGREGIGKSKILSIMASAEYFNDNIPISDNKASAEALRNAWIVEFAELTAMKRTENEQIKAFVTRTQDMYRPAYESKVRAFPRHIVSIGTTNEEQFLRGETGNRRMWPIPVKGTDRTALEELKQVEADRDQLWAEAMHRYRNGEDLFLNSEQDAIARDLQKRFNENEDDPMRGRLEEFLETPLPADWSSRSIESRRAWYKGNDPLEAEGVIKRDKMCALEFLCEFENIDPKNAKFERRRVNKMMREMEGWREIEKVVKVRHYGSQRGAFEKVTK